MRNNRGFTLLEMIVVLCLVGFLSLGITVLFANIYEAYIQAKSSTETAATVQCALSRISIELQNASPTWIISNGTDEINYYSPNLMILRTIRTKNGSIELLPDSASTNAYQLLPGSITIEYIDTAGTSNSTWTKGQADLKIIQVNITVPAIDLTDGQDLTFSTRIIPRG